MLGQRLRLMTATIAVMNEPEKQTAVQLPAGAEIVILEQIRLNTPLNSRQQVDVEWNGKVVSMFLVDIHEKGERLPPQSKERAVSD